MDGARRPAWVAPTQYWSTVAALVIWLLVLVVWRDRPPRSRPASIPATEFSAERAWPVLSYLADTIGYRIAGTPGADSAAAYLVRTLRGVPGIQVTTQDATGAWLPPGRGVAIAYAVRNVLVRIPGRSRDALLLSAHYDSPPGSVGAADDGVAAASLVEVIRALAAGGPLAHTVIVNLNDAEEQGLVGSHAFTHHPWARDVRAFVNLESAGPSGKAVLFQAGPGNPWLVDAYARAVPYPYGTVMAQDIFQSGAIPSDTDFRIYRDFGALRGLDIALYEGGWAYHTQRDRTWMVAHGTVQHMGENALALARALANGPLPGDVSAERAVYYDVLGLAMLHYGAHAAVVLAVLALLLGAGALVLARRRHRLRARDAALGAAFALVSLAAGVLSALALAALAAYALGHPMSWFAAPGAATVAFALAALAPIILLAGMTGAALRRHGVDLPARTGAVLGGVLIAWMLVLAALTLVGLGSAYVALWWVVGIAAGLALLAVMPDEWWWVGALIGAVPAATLTLGLLVMLVRLFAPVFGRLPLAIAPDLVLAALVAVPASLLALALAPGAMRAGAAGWSAAICAVLALAAMGVSLARPRYTFARPQRLEIRHVEGPTSRTLRVVGEDYDTPRQALANAPEMRPVPGSGERPLVFQAPAGPTGFAAPAVRLLGTRADPADGTRVVALRITAPGAFRIRLRAPAGRITDWSLPSPMPRTAAARGRMGADFVAPPDTGWRLELRIRGAASLPLTVEALRAATTPAAAALRRRLPPWTDVHVIAVNGAETVIGR
ncbi:MAG TPA: M28 family peptidase [Gemmatimonadaceae bacterium]|nr:M28 family peptidase [Gemmatimonadaceae bacterium]